MNRAAIAFAAQEARIRAAAIDAAIGVVKKFEQERNEAAADSSTPHNHRVLFLTQAGTARDIIEELEKLKPRT